MKVSCLAQKKRRGSCAVAYNQIKVMYFFSFLTDIFETIKRGKRLKKSDHISGNIPYISSTKMNNGCDGFLGNQKGVRKFRNCLTIANSGSVGSVFYHDYQFIYNFLH